MSDSESTPPVGGAKEPRERAAQIADQIAHLMKDARSRRFDFLAYLLAMALREARRLSRDERGPGSGG